MREGCDTGPLLCIDGSIENHEGDSVIGGGGRRGVVGKKCGSGGGVSTQSCPIPIHLTLMAKQHSDCSWGATVLTENASGNKQHVVPVGCCATYMSDN